MKKLQVLFWALAAILFIGSAQTAMAQKRKPNKRTTVQTHTPQRTSTERFVKEVAFYNARVNDFCIDSKYIYFVEKKPTMLL